MNLHPQFIPVINSKPQDPGLTEGAWGRDDGYVDAHPSGSVIKCALESGELLAIGKLH